jgi:hypothetical protein
MFAIEHPSDRTLASLWSEDLPATATESILEHLESCAECEQRLATMDSPIEQYRRTVKLVDAHLPEPPRPWADIWVEMERADRPVQPITMRPTKVIPARPMWISAIAAAILLGLLIWPRGGSVARAETLLVCAKASADRVHSRKKSHLRVVTRQTLFVRPAVLASDGPGDDSLRAQFLTARYDWNDPLSAAAFRGWREQLPHKTDRLSESGEPIQYRLETTTTDSAVQAASIIFEGPDLTPVSLRLVFDGGGWVEITAIPEAPATASAAPDRASAKVPAVPEPHVTDRQLAERELAVRLAIDTLSNETPAPVTVEVTREGSIIVTPYHLSPEQGRQLSESLSGKEGVLLHPMERDSGPANASGGDEEPAIGTVGMIASLAHLLADDADRFPPAREALLEPVGRAALKDLRVRRMEQLISQLDKLRNHLAAAHEITGLSDSPMLPPASAPAPSDLVRTAGALNRLVTAVYTTGADHIDASVAMPELTREMSELSRLASQYQRYLKPPVEERR